MKRAFILEYWQDGGWYVGKLKEIPGVFSQGETLQALEESIADAYQMMVSSEQSIEHPPSQFRDVLMDVA